MSNNLKNIWSAAWAEIGAVPSSGLYEEVVQRYSATGRAYHNLQHLEECFRQFERLSTS